MLDPHALIETLFHDGDTWATCGVSAAMGALGGLAHLRVPTSEPVSWLRRVEVKQRQQLTERDVQRAITALEQTVPAPGGAAPPPTFGPGAPSGDAAATLRDLRARYRGA